MRKLGKMLAVLALATAPAACAPAFQLQPVQVGGSMYRSNSVCGGTARFNIHAAQKQLAQAQQRYSMAYAAAQFTRPGMESWKAAATNTGCR